MSLGDPIRYSPGVEEMQPDEQETIAGLNQSFDTILEDAISLPRGLALKVLDVQGPRLPGAEGTTQDFVMVNEPVFQAKTTDRAEGAKRVMSSVLRGVNTALGAVGIESSLVQTLGGAPNVDPLGETYYSVTPFRYGDYIAKFSVAPVSPALRQLTGKTIDASGQPDAIRDTMQAEMQGIDGVWELRVQLCRDLDRQPVEDPTVEWKESEAPFQTVATITVPRQDSWDASRVQAVNEAMRFSVWTGLATHQPLGNINRARRDTYQHSAQFREKRNRCPMREPG